MTTMSGSRGGPPAGAASLVLDRDGDSLRVSGPLSMAAVAAAASRGAMALAEGVAVVDLAAVSHTDSAGLALLLDWTRDAARRQAALRIDNPPAALRDLARLYRVEAFIPFAPGAARP